MRKTVLEYLVLRMSLCIVMVTVRVRASRVLLRWRRASVFVHVYTYIRYNIMLWQISLEIRLHCKCNDLDVLCIIDMSTIHEVHVLA